GIALYFTLFPFTDRAPTEIYTLSLHDALPICTPVELRRSLSEVQERFQLRKPGGLALARPQRGVSARGRGSRPLECRQLELSDQDRKSTRLNSSHDQISYAVFCLKKKKNDHHH